MIPTDKIIKIVEDINIKDYQLIKKVDNFYIWKLNDKKRYIRLTLIREEWNEKQYYYWNLELDFRPFCYKHNHREGANIKSMQFKEVETSKCYSYFMNLIYMIEKIHGGLKT